MLNNKTISVIIPCKNEDASLYSMLSKMPSYVDEVIVIDNNSTDNTAFIAKTFGAKVFTEKRNIDGVGYGFAHLTGIKKAKGDILVALDGDDTYPIGKIKEIVSYMEKSGTDFVSCSRFPLSNSKAISPLRRLGIRILNLQVSVLYRYKVRDILSGMWVVRRETVKKMNLSNGEWNFSPEIKLSAITNADINFSEFHISHDVRLNGLSKQNIWKTGTNHLLYIVNRRISTDNSLSIEPFKKAIQSSFSLTQNPLSKFASRIKL